MGYQDPQLGWVGVRADASGGSVHASVVPGSADAAQALGGHLEGLNAYLAEHHSTVEPVTMAAPESHATGFGTDQGSSGNMQQGAGDNAGQGTASSGQDGAQSPVSNFSSTSFPARAGGAESNYQPTSPAGSHISVMA